ncbi:LamG-like jellyroll fold domain-containing protein [Streptomyces sp. NBC_00102]|uniref:LamG-like jellyroll fold domain-containing protein n=1 Tax=Streptomyces sp. NBC_00102 TaxID=2975652 RepID=UPI002250B6FD|nr:LamG-like jellyroll fold domain-containing protein [Streptomyces sp. NBC_00102]MCX5399862.1 LamG domain-containing protein [Streptomyces sp. NBC_00102]
MHTTPDGGPDAPERSLSTEAAAHSAGCGCPRTADLEGEGLAAKSRRTFLRGAGVLGAGVAATATGLLGGATPAFASDKDASDAHGRGNAKGRGSRGTWSPDPENPRFTFVVMPDTQYMFDIDRIHPAPMEASFRYVLDPAGRAGGRDENIVFLAHLGDVTNNGHAEEYAAVTKVFDMLDDAGAAYGVLAGNHDVGGDDQRGSTPYLDTFGPARAKKSPAYHSSSPDGYNTSHIFRAGGRSWMVLSLDWRMSAAGFAWANAVIKENPTLPVIVTTHEIVGSYDDGSAELSAYGQQMWDGLIKDNDQIFLTLNGHYWPPGSTVKKNSAGHDVHLHITNYQDRYYGGSGMLRSYRFDLNRGRIDIATFSPWMRERAAEDELNAAAAQEIELTSPVDYFSMDIDFEKRFAGFAPVPERAPRAARRMVVPGTLAYWRFDGSGSEGGNLPVGTVVQDQAGNGNDLVLQQVPGAAANALTWTGDHHPDQPGHGGLVFAGQGNPVSGAFLRTVDRAPINAETFPHGYTIELFFKVPADWNGGRNGWSSMLSRAGTAAEAGKNGPGSTADEPVMTLGLSGSLEIQWNAYPLNMTGATTAWSHLLQQQEWWHVAVVNDGKVSKLYVNGCEEGRNPTSKAVGLASLHKPFLVGGYEWAGKANQVFHGTLGDVRIVDRALRVDQFMNA